MATTNEFIGSVRGTGWSRSGTVHPELSVEENLKHLRDNGIVGVKLHPLFQDLSLGDPRVHDILAALAEEGMPVVTHVGAGGDEAANERGRPEAVAAARGRAAATSTLIACHYGGYHLLDEAEEHVVGSSVTLETSWPPTMAELDPERVVAIIRGTAPTGSSTARTGRWPTRPPRSPPSAPWG